MVKYVISVLKKLVCALKRSKLKGHDEYKPGKIREILTQTVFIHAGGLSLTHTCKNGDFGTVLQSAATRC